jgi:hypothetical protein
MVQADLAFEIKIKKENFSNQYTKPQEKSSPVFFFASTSQMNSLGR